MKLSKIVEESRQLSAPYRVEDGRGFKLSSVRPEDTGRLDADDKGRAKEMLASGVAALATLQERLYAQDSWALLLIFQAMDAAGKDSAIKHVMSGVNPQGCEVHSFKAPSSEELDHDYLWRCVKVLPERGRIGVFNRSYYEEVLVVRVHPELVVSQKMPSKLVTASLWTDRCKDIRRFEDYLGRNGVRIVKFFLHVSKREQKRRFLERLDIPEKNWKFSEGDVREREHWGEYMRAYQDAIQRTATLRAPWYVVPADHKWFTRIVVAGAIIDTLARLDIGWPRISPARKRELARARRALLRQ